MIVFLSIVLTIYSLTNTYIFFRGYYAIASSRDSRILYTILFISLALTFIAGKFLEYRHSTVLSDILNITGGFWMGFMLYGFLFLFLSDITGLLLRIPGIINSQNIVEYKKWSFLVATALSILLIAGGFVNAIIPVAKEYNIRIDKPAGEIRSLRVAAVSDIHLGSIIRKRSIKKLSALLEKIKPDVVFLLGDIVDGELGPVLRDDLLKYFTAPHARYGLYAITGNHEFIGGAERTIPYIESKGIRVLKDETILLPGGIQVIGRLDRDSFRYFAKERLPIEELMKDIDHSKPVIMLDHQPLRLEESERNGVDLQLSGHTHNGQMWPLNYLTRKIFELSYGYLEKGKTKIIVSSGFGLWGPRIRSGSRSEVLMINILFEGKREASE
ncbi:MAG: metallophosphoesterase [Bacteroidales bacterium]|nr:metallophosphoesterase [Bacteroidales bacterium]